MARIIPLTGTDELRQLYALLGLLLDNEVHTTDDHHRLFFENYHIGGGVFHGRILSEVAMLALTTDSDRSVWPGDFCYREDEETLFFCVTNRGETAEDWIAGGANLNLAQILDGGNGSGSNLVGEDELDGGTAFDEFDDIVDGNPEDEAL